MPPPAEGAIPIDTIGALLANALVDGGIVGIDEAIEQPILNRAFTQANWLLAQWARKRWLAYQLVDYSFVSTGALNYPVGLNGTININPRPDKLEYAALRFLNATNNLPVDIPLDIITSKEEYWRIRVKNVGTLPWRIFYDPAWPVGVLFPWPVPQATIYEIHCGFKVVLPRFTALNQPIKFPPEYEPALNWCLARRFRASHQLPADPEINALAREGLNVIRGANAAIPVLQQPSFLRRRTVAYDYRGDSTTT